MIALVHKIEAHMGILSWLFGPSTKNIQHDEGLEDDGWDDDDDAFAV